MAVAVTTHRTQDRGARRARRRGQDDARRAAARDDRCDPEARGPSSTAPPSATPSPRRSPGKPLALDDRSRPSRSATERIDLIDTPGVADFVVRGGARARGRRRGGHRRERDRRRRGADRGGLAPRGARGHPTRGRRDQARPRGGRSTSRCSPRCATRSARASLPSSCPSARGPRSAASPTCSPTSRSPTTTGAPTQRSGARRDRRRRAPVREQLVEGIVLADDELMSRYLDGDALSMEELEGALTVGLADGSVVPVVCVSGETGIGVDRLATLLSELSPSRGVHGLARRRGRGAAARPERRRPCCARSRPCSTRSSGAITWLEVVSRHAAPRRRARPTCDSRERGAAPHAPGAARQGARRRSAR